MKYTVRYERDEDGAWTAQVKEEPAAITHGRTIAEARRRAREALGAVLDREVKASEILDEVILPAQLQRALDRARELRKRIEEIQALSSKATAAAVEAFTKKGLSNTDAGELLDLSRQRLHQLRHGG